MNNQYEHLNTGLPLVTASLEIVQDKDDGKWVFAGIYPDGSDSMAFDTFSDALEYLFASIEKRNGQHAGEMRADAARCLVDRSIGDLL